MRFYFVNSKQTFMVMVNKLKELVQNEGNEMARQSSSAFNIVKKNFDKLLTIIIFS